jgi:hypothetical protein
MNTLCIPKVTAATTSAYIQTIWKQTQLGPIVQYTELPWKHDQAHKRILLKVAWNTEHPHHAAYQEILNAGHYISIVHKFPSEWRVFLAKN